MMADQAIKWIKQLKGRKIRRSEWVITPYIIPTGEWRMVPDKDPYYWKFRCINEWGAEDCWCSIHEGFDRDCDGFKWELVETFDDYLEMYHND